MDIEKIGETGNLDFSGIPSSYYLLGLLSAFENRFQSVADRQMEVISWKQFFAIVCIDLCREPPTLGQLAELMGSSHQNVKQILLKLQKKGFAELQTDPGDRRKQRVVLTRACREFCEQNSRVSGEIMEKMFAGIPETELQTTIRTITKMAANLEKEI